MNLDIEKIKAALGEIHKLQQETAYSLMDANKDMMRYMSAMAIIGGKVQEALATLAAYDPGAIRREVTFTFPWVYDNGDGQVYEGFTGKRENCHPIKLEGETLRMLVYEVNQFYKIKQQYLFELSKRPNSFHPNQYHGHAHTVDGIWDSDNGLLSGCKCAACMLHNAAIMSAGKE